MLYSLPVLGIRQAFIISLVYTHMDGNHDMAPEAAPEMAPEGAEGAEEAPAMDDQAEESAE